MLAIWWKISENFDWNFDFPVLFGKFWFFKHGSYWFFQIFQIVIENFIEIFDFINKTFLEKAWN